jgi:hypothetical protein
MAGTDEQMVGQAVQIGQRMGVDQGRFVECDRRPLGTANDGARLMEHLDRLPA